MYRNNYLRKCKVGNEKLFCFACIHTLLKKGSHVDILINEKKRSVNVIIEQGRLHNPKIIQLLLGCCHYFCRQCLVFRGSKYKMAVNTLITVFSQNTLFRQWNSCQLTKLTSPWVPFMECWLAWINSKPYKQSMWVWNLNVSWHNRLGMKSGKKITNKNRYGWHNTKKSHID